MLIFYTANTYTGKQEEFVGSMSRDLERLKAAIKEIYPIPGQNLERLLKQMKEVSYGRNEMITAKGEVERYLYFVLEGYQRAYYLKDNKEHVIAFSRPYAFSGMPLSFLNQTPSPYYLSCITPSRLLRMPKEQLDRLMAQDREVEQLIRRATEKVFAEVSQRYAELMAMSIEERFRQFTSRDPHMLQEVPHKYLASYLNMDPTNFSKLLGKMRIG